MNNARYDNLCDATYCGCLVYRRTTWKIYIPSNKKKATKMKVTFEIDTDKENVDLCELEQLKHAGDMAAALYELQEAILGWYRHPSDNRPLNADTLHDTFYEILQSNSISLDKIYA